MSRRLSEEPVGGRDGTITSRSAYWLGPYLLYMLPSASSITNTVVPSSAPAESSPADRLGGALTATGTAAAPAQNGTTHVQSRHDVPYQLREKHKKRVRITRTHSEYDWSAAAATRPTCNVRIAFLRRFGAHVPYYGHEGPWRSRKRVWFDELFSRKKGVLDGKTDSVLVTSNIP